MMMNWSGGTYNNAAYLLVNALSVSSLFQPVQGSLSVGTMKKKLAGSKLGLGENGEGTDPDCCPHALLNVPTEQELGTGYVSRCFEFRQLSALLKL